VFAFAGIVHAAASRVTLESLTPASPGAPESPWEGVLLVDGLDVAQA
jgi:hypothetical protein